MTSSFQTLLLSSLLACSCQSLEFKNPRIVDEGIDQETQSYRMQLEFELLDDRGLPVQADDQPTIWVLEDGVPCTSESIRWMEQKRIYQPVVLLLDTSASMRASMAELQESAREFSVKLRRQGFEAPRIFRFSRTVEEIEEIDPVEAAFEERPDERWTSLYYAVQYVIRENPGSVVVVFSDGADNYSQNFGVSSVEDVEALVERDSVAVHAIGCGSVGDEMDRNGVNGAKALKRLAINGTYRYAESVDSLDSTFAHIADRLRNIFSLEYYSPNLTGTHELVLRAKKGDLTGESSSLYFRPETD